MKIRQRLFLLALVALPLAAAPKEKNPKGPTAPPLSPRFVQVRDKIDVLYRYRNETPAPPDPQMNPFRTPGMLPAAMASANTSSTDAPAVAQAPTNDLLLLQQSVALLKVTGTVQIAAKVHLVINGKPYKKGDVVQTQLLGQPIYLRVRDVTPHSVTLALNETEMTLKF